MLEDEQKASRGKDIDNWLPITSSRDAKWWYSAFHNVTAMVGSGVLALPYAMAGLGWGPGVVVLILSWIITLYTLWQMVEMHEMVPGKRFDRYHELGQHAFVKSLASGLWTTYFIMIFASCHFVLSHLPNFNSISGVSFSAAAMSLTLVNSTTTGKFFHFCHALGEVAFAYAGHNVVLEIQATIPSTPEKPSKGPMWKGVMFAYMIVAICYFPVALVGYRVFGNSVADNILITLEKPGWLIAAANIFVVIHVVGSYQIYAIPVFDMMETLLVKKLKFTPCFRLRLITRTSYVAFTMFIAMMIPFFGSLMAFLGGLAFAPTTYFLPCIMWLAVYKPKMFSLSWCSNWICIVLGVVLMILAPIGALRQIILQAKTYKLFS
ncbi:Lysine histidine transporter 1 [Vitis vinifera]|uniref:Lysine histidine transporter 1 n=1 Tax=Vitis vinifera TaxID=29760 RepID=A0A438DIX9_VITVI|nr:Lysine histidine transporter 1 [Vitis vinifera]